MLTPLLAKVGGRVVAVYDQFGMFNVVFQPPPPNLEQIINSLRTHPSIQGVFNDKIPTLTQFPMPYQPQSTPTGIDRVDADLSAARSGDKKGSVNVDIAILDTGVNGHVDLNVYDCRSFVLPPAIQPNCGDGDGHGTHVAGIAAAKDNDKGVVGTAPGARIWALKVLPDNPANARMSDVVFGLNYVGWYAHLIEVVNLSLELPGFDPPTFVAIETLVNKGVVVVVAAGNDNVNAAYISPAGFPSAITVSAITDSDGKCGGLGTVLQEVGGAPQYNAVNNPDDFFASYSNFGEIVDLAAPGSHIVSTLNTGGYGSESGTSMAAPHVAGAAALLKSLHPNASPKEVDAFLKKTGSKAPFHAYGGGNPLTPCDGFGLGYFNDRYPLHGGNPMVRTDNVKEPLLNMREIKAPPPLLPLMPR
jgi:subtilisin family serine protease